MKIVPPSPIPGTSRCTKCGEVKPTSDFHEFTLSKNASSGWCKPCHRQYQKDRYIRTNGRESRDAHLRETYGITLEQYNAKLMAQGMMCAICGKKAPSLDSSEWGKYSYPVDHCHETKKVRGILCPQCNSGLGHFKDRPELLRSAIRYLQQSAKVEVRQARIPLFDDYEQQT